MKDHAEKIIEKVNNLEDVDTSRKEVMIEKIKEWETDASSESNTLAMTFEKFWLDLEPIFAELGLI